MQGVIYCGSLGVVNNFHLNLGAHDDLHFCRLFFVRTKNKVSFDVNDWSEIAIVKY